MIRRASTGTAGTSRYRVEGKARLLKASAIQRPSATEAAAFEVAAQTRRMSSNVRKTCPKYEIDVSHTVPA